MSMHVLFFRFKQSDESELSDILLSNVSLALIRKVNMYVIVDINVNNTAKCKFNYISFLVIGVHVENTAKCKYNCIKLVFFLFPFQYKQYPFIHSSIYLSCLAILNIEKCSSVKTFATDDVIHCFH